MKLIHADKNGLTVHTDEQNPGQQYVITKDRMAFANLHFQSGSVDTAGVNGLTNEALIEILIDRTEQLDKIVPCIENKVALLHLNTALKALEARAKRREAEQQAASNSAVKNG